MQDRSNFTNLNTALYILLKVWYWKILSIDANRWPVFIFSKSVKVAVTNDILEDIQVIEPQIRTSDPKLYEVSTNKRAATSYSLSKCVFVYKKALCKCHSIFTGVARWGWQINRVDQHHIWQRVSGHIFVQKRRCSSKGISDIYPNVTGRCTVSHLD